MLTPDASVVTLGSCFARELRDYLAAKGLGAANVWVPSGLNNTFALLDFVSWCVTGQETGRGYRYDRDDEGRIREWTPESERELYLEGFRTAGAFVFTLGLAEVWQDRETEAVFWRGVPKDVYKADRHVFRLSTVEENMENVVRMVELVRSVNASAPIVLTLSPVPLRATFRGISCLTADAVSKSVLRVALDLVIAAGSTTSGTGPRSRSSAGSAATLRGRRSGRTRGSRATSTVASWRRFSTPSSRRSSRRTPSRSSAPSTKRRDAPPADAGRRRRCASSSPRCRRTRPTSTGGSAAELERRGHEVAHVTVSRAGGPAAARAGPRRALPRRRDGGVGEPDSLADEVRADRGDVRHAALRDVYRDGPAVRRAAGGVVRRAHRRHFLALERIFDEVRPDVVVPEVGNETMRTPRT